MEQEKLHLSGTGESTDVTSTKRRFVGGNILFGKLRPYFRKVVRPDFDGICSTDIWVIEPKENVDSRFLFYWCASWDFVDFLDASSEGTRMPRAKWEVAVNHRIPAFSTPEQRAIARILGALDDKIEVNRRMNETLEGMARAIFRDWFVDFGPVRAKMEGREPYLPSEISDLFPDELVDSEIGEIPKEWEIGALYDLAEITMGQSPPGRTYNDDGIGLPFYQGSTDFEFRFPSLRKYCSEPKRLARKDDVLLSVRAPVGDVNRALDECCIGRGLASIRSREDYSSWVFYRCKFLKGSFHNFNAEGTVFGSINAKDLRSLTTIKPASRLLMEFENLAGPIDSMIRIKTEEIIVLTRLRDTLLPKLMSGEIRIHDAGKIAERAVS